MVSSRLETHLSNSAASTPAAPTVQACCETTDATALFAVSVMDSPSLYAVERLLNVVLYRGEKLAIASFPVTLLAYRTVRP
jgi:hypothetical protein